MIKKIFNNVKLVAVLFVIACIILWIVEGFASVQDMVQQSWWIWLLAPILLRMYNWFTNLKQKAYDYGADTAGIQAEQKATRDDTKTGHSEKLYNEMLAKAPYSKEEAQRLRSRDIHEGLALQKGLAETSKDYSIPLYRYESGLPGRNLVRPSKIKQQFTVAKIQNGTLEFYEADASAYEKSGVLKQKFSEIPMASILKLEVVDIAKDRQLKRVGADVGQRVTQTLVSAASQTGGAKVTKANVDTARILIHYVNKEGIVFPASFVLNSNSKVGARAMQNLKDLNKTLKNFSFLGRVAWSTAVSNSAVELLDQFKASESDFDVSELTSLGGDMIKVLKWVNMLSPHDSAVVTAKLSAEMVAGALQNPAVALVETLEA